MLMKEIIKLVQGHFLSFVFLIYFIVMSLEKVLMQLFYMFT